MNTDLSEFLREQVAECKDTAKGKRHLKVHCYFYCRIHNAVLITEGIAKQNLMLHIVYLFLDTLLCVHA